MSGIDRTLISSLSASLHQILEAELVAGNEVCEATASTGDFPSLVLLAKPFLTPIRSDLPGVAYREVGDTHYWKSEYFDEGANQLLACRF